MGVAPPADHTVVQVRCDGPRPFTAGLVLDGDGRCVSAAPILARLVLGHTAPVIRRMLRARGWSAVIVVRRSGCPQSADPLC
jgi:hypothetical protein